MTSIGNDIVALEATNAQRANNQRFYSRVLVPAEKGVYANGNLPKLCFEDFVWLLWSIKESVYKFSKRNFAQIAFSPKKIIVQSMLPPEKEYFPLVGASEIENISFVNDECFSSLVHSATGRYYSRSIITNQFIYTVVNNTENFGEIWWGIKHIDNDSPMVQSHCVREFFMEKLKAIHPNVDICITKSPVGYPVVQINGNETQIPVSFAHHQRFVAYAFVYDKAIKI